MERAADDPVIGLILDHLRPVASLEEMPYTAAPLTVPSSVGREKLLHTQGEVGARGLDQQVQMVAHEDEGGQFPLTPQHRAPQVVEQSFTVPVVQNDPLAAVAPGHHVIDVALKLDAKSSGHLPCRAHRSEELNKTPKTKSDTHPRPPSDGHPPSDGPDVCDLHAPRQRGGGGRGLSSATFEAVSYSESRTWNGEGPAESRHSLRFPQARQKPRPGVMKTRP